MMGNNTINIRDEEHTKAIARDLAAISNSGDLITLSGNLGAGKTLFARAFIRAYQSNANLEVASPTYLIAIEYDSKTNKSVTHFDLYRLGDTQEVDELGIDEALEQGVVLIEWPQKALKDLPKERSELTIEIGSGDTRVLKIEGSKSVVKRQIRSVEIGEFLRTHCSDDYTRHPFAADASARNYELIEIGDETQILMDAPKMADGKPTKDELPYSQIAHLAEEVRPFVAISNMLQAEGFCAPKIYAADYDRGLVLLEHLGDGKIVDDNNNPIPDRYVQSIEMLAHMHAKNWQANQTMNDGNIYNVPDFDIGAMMVEVNLLSKWYLEDANQTTTQSITAYNEIWTDLCKQAQSFEKSLLLRDYHSPNIIWRGDKSGLDKIGLIDFQDAMIGPAAYDVVSLAQDARVIVSQELEEKLLAHYIEMRKKLNVGFDVDKFKFEYAVMGAQRASKILGIFVRLDKRDSKPEYRKLIPGVQNYLTRNLHHPRLSKYRDWCKKVLEL